MTRYTTTVSIYRDDSPEPIAVVVRVDPAQPPSVGGPPDSWDAGCDAECCILSATRDGVAVLLTDAEAMQATDDAVVAAPTLDDDGRDVRHWWEA